MKLTEEKKKELELKIAAEAADHGFTLNNYAGYMVFKRRLLNSDNVIAGFRIHVDTTGACDCSLVDVRDVLFYSIEKRKLVKYNSSFLKRKHGYVDVFSSTLRLCYDAETFNLNHVFGAFFKKVDQITAEMNLEARRVVHAKKLAEIRDSEISYKLDEVKNKLQETFPGMSAEVKTVLAGNHYEIALFNFIIPEGWYRKCIALSQAEYKEYNIENRSIMFRGREEVTAKDLPDTGETPLYTMHRSMWSSPRYALTRSYGEWGISVQYAGEDNWRLHLTHGGLPFDETKIVNSTEIMSWVEWVIGVEKKFYAAFKEYTESMRVIMADA